MLVSFLRYCFLRQETLLHIASFCHAYIRGYQNTWVFFAGPEALPRGSGNGPLLNATETGLSSGPAGHLHPMCDITFFTLPLPLPLPYQFFFFCQARGIHGEHSVSTGEDAGVFDISNRRRLGLSEVQCVQDMYNGVKKLLEIEKEALA